LRGQQVLPLRLGGHRVDGRDQTPLFVPEPDVGCVEVVDERAAQGADLQGAGKALVEGRFDLPPNAVASHVRSGEGEEEDDARQAHVDQGANDPTGDARNGSRRVVRHERKGGVGEEGPGGGRRAALH
jgi:hypothetical protein